MNMFSLFTTSFDLTADMLLAHSKRTAAASARLSPILYDPRSDSVALARPYTPFVSELNTLHAIVGAEQHNLRLDRALGELFPSQSRNFLAKLVTSGKVLVDGTAALKPSHRVEEGQKLTVEIPPAAPSSME